ncbi:MAG: hypothetical protein L3J01_03980 [Thiomicrorhabdus sp.]|nr:hypothetical protein [Thiomicrorhabdus sp.]
MISFASGLIDNRLQASEVSLRDNAVVSEIKAWEMSWEHGNLNQLADLINSSLGAAVVTRMDSILAERLRNDWGRYQHLYRFVGQTLGITEECKKRFIVSVLLRRAGLKTLFGRGASLCITFVSSHETLYQIAYLKHEKEKYYALTPEGRIDIIPAVSIFSFAQGGRMFDLTFDAPSESYQQSLLRGYQFNKHGIIVDLPFSKSTLMLFRSHPQMEYIAYINTPTSFELEEKLKLLIEPTIAMMSDVQIAQLLMDFIHHNIVWEETDNKNPQEKVQFFEETLFEQSGDCEDLVILYAKLIKLFLKKPVVLLKYEDHLSLAIALDMASGKQVQWKGTSYVVADPSLKRGKIGEVMPSLLDSPYTIIDLGVEFNFHSLGS